MSAAGLPGLTYEPDERSIDMALRDHRVSAQIAVSDMGRAVEFYEQRLGLPVTGEPHEGARTYACGDGTVLHVYASPAHAGKTPATVAQWNVGDVERAVDELGAAGVRFEQYDEPKTDARGIHDTGYGKVAWFRDPDGNTFALEE
jgi:catechol 2,3-dioxygenase-like lactoylglutathione lyase family enzyme